MSDTKVDMPKVCQMLDAGWSLRVFKNQMGSYTAEGTHANELHMRTCRDRIKATIAKENPELTDNTDLMDMLADLDTDDFTPEQAMTRLAYKVFGEVL
jgi:hypothetical protein